MGQVVPYTDLPPGLRARMGVSSPMFTATAEKMEQDLGLPPGRLSRATFSLTPDTDPLSVLINAARDAKANPDADAVPTAPRAPAGLAKPEPPVNPAADMPGWQRGAAGVGKSIVDTARGFGQLTGAMSQQDIDEAAQLDRGLMNTPEGFIGNLTGHAAQAAIPMAGAAKVGQLAAKVPVIGAAAASPTLQAGVGGAAYTALQPVESGGSRGFNAAVSAALPAGVKLGGELTKRAFTPMMEKLDPVKQGLLKLAQEHNIPVTVDQLTDSAVGKFMLGMMNKLPFTGRADVEAKQQSQFNKAVAKLIGQGDKDNPMDAFAAYKKASEYGYNELKARNNLQLEPWHVDALGDSIKNYAQTGVSRTMQADLKSLKDLQKQIVNNTDASGLMTGAKYKELRSRIGAYRQAEADPGMKQAYKEFQSVLDNAFKSGLSGEDAVLLGTLDRHYANAKTLSKAITSDKSQDFDYRRLGQVTSAQTKDNTGPRGAVVFGEGTPDQKQMAGLSRLGVEILDTGEGSGKGLQTTLHRMGHRAAQVAVPTGLGAAAYTAQHAHPIEDDDLMGALMYGGGLGTLGILGARYGNSQAAVRGNIFGRGLGTLTSEVGTPATVGGINAWNRSVGAKKEGEE